MWPPLPAEADMPNGKPNILVIWGDDIGISNLSCYSDGLMGYKTPNIDRIANEGMRFTDSYGEQSCTAGRASFITGQSGFRTGLTKVGFPGADIGLQAVIAGPHASDVASLRPKLEIPSRLEPIRGLRIALSVDLGCYQVDEDVA